MPKQLARVETHGHYIPPAVFGTAGAYGPEEIFDNEAKTWSFRAGKFKTEPTKMSGPKNKAWKLPPSDPRLRVAEMDKLDIDVMGISASPVIYCYGASVKDGIRYAKVYNDEMAKYCSQAPERLFFIPTLPMQDVEAALAEVKRAHGMGGRGVNIGTDSLAQMDLDDKRLSPLYEYCAANDVPIWLHPAPPGTDDPNYDAASSAPDKFLFTWLIGYPQREMVAFATIVFSGILDRYPNLKVCLPHGGGYVPYQFARLEYAWQGKLTKAIVNKKPVREYLKNFYFDNIVHDPRGRRFLLEIMGPDNILVGSNFGGWDWVNGFDFAQDMTTDPAVLHKLCAGNAIEVFKLSGMGREV
jgi:aminocarboxymuconate-semialdehyde decarboxylase